MASEVPLSGELSLICLQHKEQFSTDTTPIPHPAGSDFLLQSLHMLGGGQTLSVHFISWGWGEGRGPEPYAQSEDSARLLWGRRAHTHFTLSDFRDYLIFPGRNFKSPG